MKKLVTITGAPASKGAVIRTVTWELTKAVGTLVINRMILHGIVRAMIK
jgi:hypothetical protein